MSSWRDAARTNIKRYRMQNVVVRPWLPGGRQFADGQQCRVVQQSHAFRFGCLLNGWGLAADATREARFRSAFRGLFNYASVLFQWGRSLSQRTDYEPADGVTEYAQRDAMVNWCRAQQIEVKGHPLVFFFQPSWVAAQPEGSREELLWRRVRREVGSFAGRIRYWETVNEASWQGKRSLEFNALASRDVFNRLGPRGVIEQTHRLVSEADPDARVILNESYPTEEFRALLRELLDHGIRVDAIGFQSHGLTKGVTPESLLDICDRWSEFGIPIHFTELMFPSCSAAGRPALVYQMEVNAAYPTCPAGEARQAEELEAAYTALFSHPSVEAISWWGLTDWMSCLDAAVGLLRADLSAKPAYHRLDQLLNTEWRTRADLSCRQGTIQFGGFLGDYEITVPGPTGNLHGFFNIRKGANVIDVQLTPATAGTAHGTLT